MVSVKRQCSECTTPCATTRHYPVNKSTDTKPRPPATTTVALNHITYVWQNKKAVLSHGEQSDAGRCCCKFRCVSNFTMASIIRAVSLPQHGFLVGLCTLQWIICQKVINLY